MDAALLMSSVLSCARAHYDDCRGPLELVQRLNDLVRRVTEGRGFVTLFAGWLDVASGSLRYVNAGHAEPYLLRQGELRTLELTGVPVGMFSTYDWEVRDVFIQDRELFALFSDGIPDTYGHDDFFGLERLAAVLREVEGESDLSAAGDRIMRRIDEFAGGAPRADDVVLVLMRRERLVGEGAGA
jgi:sigma-B regulation protein RsbU (phosphoserine phosphatase)